MCSQNRICVSYGDENQAQEHDFVNSENREFHVHLVSDATGETLNAIARAALAQFEGVTVNEHFYALVRSSRQLQRAIEHIREEPGLVFFTLVNPELRRELLAACATMSVPSYDVLETPIGVMRQFLGAAETHRPGGQHDLDQRYNERIEALNFTIAHDDGQILDRLDEAEVVLVGASRTSKTPTCVYLAIRGVRAANVPLVPGMPLPRQLLLAANPLIVGLWASPDRLVQVRRNRLNTLGEVRDTAYVDLESVRAEVAATRKLFDAQDWPVIDVSRRSVEETAAAVLNLLAEKRLDAEE
ncbi:MAG: kinase/pyrophosphorylase [Proteobacteria bacterium]|nr:kinase/pyrophosphorylase [Pseudomonadota bacterium]